MTTVTIDSSEKLEELIPILERHIPLSLMALGTVKCALQYPEFNLEIRCVYHEEELVGLIGLRPRSDVTDIIVWSSEQHIDQVGQALEQLDEWTDSYLHFQALQTDLIPVVLKRSSQRNDKAIIACYVKCYYLPKELALNIEIKSPPGTYLKELDASDAELVYKTWKFCYLFSVESIVNDILKFPAVGLYEEKSNQLVSWITLNCNGFITRLFTLDEYRGRGYARAVLAFHAKKLAQAGYFAYGFIDDVNMSSIKSFTAVGYQPQYSGCFLECPNC